MDPKVIWSIVIVTLTVALTAFFGMDGPAKLKNRFGKK